MRVEGVTAQRRALEGRNEGETCRTRRPRYSIGIVVVDREKVQDIQALRELTTSRSGASTNQAPLKMLASDHPTILILKFSNACLE